MATKNPMAELRALGEAELRQRLRQSQHDLEAARLKARQGSLEQPHHIRDTRRMIARLWTVLNANATTRPAKQGAA